MSNETLRREIKGPNEAFLANLLYNTSGEPPRHIITGRRRRPVGIYASVKNRKGMPWESHLELYGFYHAETSPDVVSYVAQPHTLELLVDGELRTYTPDRQDFMGDGTCQIIEIKDKFKPEKDPAYTKKLQRAAYAYQALGWQYRIMDRQEITAAPLFNALEEIQTFRHTEVTRMDILTVASLFQYADSWPLEDVKAAFGNPMKGMAKAYAMTVRRHLTLDLEGGLNDSTPVRLVREGAPQ